MLKKAFIVIITAVIFKAFLEYIFGGVSDKSEKSDQKQIFRISQLKTTDDKLYLAILGNVYDVTTGGKHYKKGGSYDFFVGRDASRAYVTGDFKNDLNDNVDGLSENQIRDIFNWKSFYDKTYPHLGVVEGKFYTSDGQKTDHLLDLEKINKNQIKNEEKNSDFQKKFPICNSEWTQEKGITKLWCTKESGGVKRSWAGYPRLVYNPITKQESCSCVNEKDLDHPNVKLYPNCEPKSETCRP